MARAGARVAAATRIGRSRLQGGNCETRGDFAGARNADHATTDERAPTRYAFAMSEPLTAHDLWPLVLKLPHDERVRLAKLALKAAATDDAAAYRAAPPDVAEFSSEDESLAWEAEGWDEFSAKG